MDDIFIKRFDISFHNPLWRVMPAQIAFQIGVSILRHPPFAHGKRPFIQQRFRNWVQRIGIELVHCLIPLGNNMHHPCPSVFFDFLIAVRERFIAVGRQGQRAAHLISGRCPSNTVNPGLRAAACHGADGKHPCLCGIDDFILYSAHGGPFAFTGSLGQFALLRVKELYGLIPINLIP